MKTSMCCYRLFKFAALLLLCSCNKQYFPIPDSLLNTRTSVDNNTEPSTRTYPQLNDDEYFLAVREAERNLRNIIRTHNIHEPNTCGNAEVRGNTNICLLKQHIGAIGNEIARLYNRISGNEIEIKKLRNQLAAPRPAPATNSDLHKELSTQVEQLTTTNAELTLEITKLNEQINTLQAQLANKEKETAPAPAVEPPHFCIIKLKKTNAQIRNITVKGNVLTFNYKLTADNILSQHPKNSFKLDVRKNITYLRISDPVAFWLQSKELIVIAANKKHGCIDREFIPR